MIYTEKLIAETTTRLMKMSLPKFKRQMEAFTSQEPGLMQFIGENLRTMQHYGPLELGTKPLDKMQEQVVLRSFILFAYQFFIINLYADTTIPNEKIVQKDAAAGSSHPGRA